MVATVRAWRCPHRCNACPLRFSCFTSARSFTRSFPSTHSLFRPNHVFEQHQGHLSVRRHTSVPVPSHLLTICTSNLSINRFRPPNALELREGSEIIVAFDDNLQTVQLRSAQVSSGPERDGFSFDRVFPMETKQHEVFDYGVKE